MPMLETTNPIIYSAMVIGDANIFRKLRDQTSSKKAMVTPCITRMKKSQKSTAPKSIKTKLIPDDAETFR